MTDETTTLEKQDALVADDEARVYELGYHLIPTLDEAARGKAVEELRTLVEEKGATILNETYPELIDLAYPMSHDMLGTRHHFSTAYFGWMYFELEPSALADIEESLRANDSVLRSLLITTTKENALSPTSYSFKREGGFSQHVLDDEEGDDEESDEPEDKKEEISEEQVDKAIDDLLPGEEEVK